MKDASGSGYGRNAVVPSEDVALTHVGFGTPMGELLRRYWQPVCLSSELTDLPKFLKILDEELVAYRDKSGRVGVLGAHCCHRGTSLEYGRIEEIGLRCCYHGWLYNEEGKCLDQPGEPEQSDYKDEIRQPWYPAEEYHGLVFAYMGPLGMFTLTKRRQVGTVAAHAERPHSPGPRRRSARRPEGACRGSSAPAPESGERGGSVAVASSSERGIGFVQCHRKPLSERGRSAFLDQPDIS